MTVGIVVGALLAIACVLLVALPYLRDPAPASDEVVVLDAGQRRLLELAEERDRALAALKEDLEADHRAGRIADDDYRALIGPLRREAAEALRALDGGRAAVDEEIPAPEPVEAAPDRA